MEASKEIKKDKLNIYSNTKNSFTALFVMLAMVITMFVGLFYIKNAFFQQSFILSFSVFLLKCFLYFGICFFSIGIIAGIIFLFQKGPVAILDKKGMWVRHYSFIPRESIEAIELCNVAGDSEAIGINIKNISTLSKGFGVGGKMGVFWAKVFNNYHITLSNIDVPNNTVLFFAKKRIEENVIH